MVLAEALPPELDTDAWLLEMAVWMLVCRLDAEATASAFCSTTRALTIPATQHVQSLALRSATAAYLIPIRGACYGCGNALRCSLHRTAGERSTVCQASVTASG